MSIRLTKKWQFVALLATAFFSLTQVPAHAQGIDDLDSLTQEQLLYALDAELDDIFEYGLDCDPECPLALLEEWIIYALYDAGDELDPAEGYITQANLDQEMREAGTNLRAVVRYALSIADDYASGPEFRNAAFVRVGPSRKLPFAVLSRLIGDDLLARRNSRTSMGAGTGQTKNVLVPTILNVR